MRILFICFLTVGKNLLGVSLLIIRSSSLPLHLVTMDTIYGYGRQYCQTEAGGVNTANNENSFKSFVCITYIFPLPAACTKAHTSRSLKIYGVSVEMEARGVNTHYNENILNGLCTHLNSLNKVGQKKLV